MHKTNSFLASGNFCLLLITFSKGLDLDQDRQYVSPDLDPSCLTLKYFFEQVNFGKKVSRRQQKLEKLPSMQRASVGELHLFQGLSVSQTHLVFNPENCYIFLFLNENISSGAFLKNHGKKFKQANNTHNMIQYLTGLDIQKLSV